MSASLKEELISCTRNLSCRIHPITLHVWEHLCHRKMGHKIEKKHISIIILLDFLLLLLCDALYFPCSRMMVCRCQSTNYSERTTYNDDDDDDDDETVTFVRLCPIGARSCFRRCGRGNNDEEKLLYCNPDDDGELLRKRTRDAL